MLRNEYADVVRHAQHLLPLLLVERDGKAPEPVNGHAAFLADPQRDAFDRSTFHPCIFWSRPVEFGLEDVVCHRVSFRVIRSFSVYPLLFSPVPVPSLRAAPPVPVLLPRVCRLEHRAPPRA